MKKLILLLIVGMLLISSVNANDSQTIIPCGGDEENLIHTFDTSTIDLSNETLTAQEVTINDSTYILPRVITMSSNLLEDATDWEYYTTFSHSGGLNVLTATKEPVLE